MKMIKINEKYRQSILFLFQWIVLALISGIVAHLVIQSFDFMLRTANTFLISLKLPYFLWTTLGALFAGSVIYKIESRAAGEGIPSYIKGLRRENGKLSLSETFFKFWAALITLGTFGTGGIIGPLGRVCAGLLSWIDDKLKEAGLPMIDSRIASICGLAAAVGAIFHSPIGGGIFAVEIIQRRQIQYQDMFPAVLSSCTAVFISRMFGGSSFFPITTSSSFMDSHMILFILLIAILAGYLGKFYAVFYNWFTRIIKREAGSFLILKVVLGAGLTAAGAYLINPDLMGTGRQMIRELFTTDLSFLTGNLPVSTPFILVLLVMLTVKFLASNITIGSGMSAGFTAPAIICGMLVSVTVASIFGIQPGTANFHALLAAGFAGILSSCMNIPLAAAVITTEIFGLHFSLAAGIASIIAFQINKYKTLYDFAYAVKDKDRQVLQSIDVNTIIENNFVSIGLDKNLGELIKVVTGSNRNLFPVLDNRHKLKGIIYLHKLRQIIFKTELYESIKVPDIMEAADEIIDSDEPMETIMEKFDRSGAWNLPVVKDGKYAGFISKSKIFPIYRDMLKRHSKE